MIFIILGIVLNLVSPLGSGGSVEALGMQIEASLGFRSVLIIIGIVLNVVVVVFAFTKNPKFPMVALAALWAGVVVALIGMFIGPSITIEGGDEQVRQMMMEQVQASYSTGALTGFIVAVVIAALISWYLMASKRVNVTYNHRVKG